MKKFYWLNKNSRDFLKRGYITEDMTAEERVHEIAKQAEKYLGIKGYAEKFEDYMSRGWFSLSSPVWANYGRKSGLPCSCNNSYIPDTTAGILTKLAEVGIMSKYGAGTSAFFGSVRGRGSIISTGGTSNGSVNFMELFESITNVISQGSTRRGSFAAYLPVDHPDVEEFLQIRSEGHPIQNMSIGITISDKWMKEMIEGDKSKRKIWTKIIQKRFETGYPYLFFYDTVKRDRPKCYKDLKFKIHSSNLCSEITLPSEEDISFVCVLSSMNLLHYDEWKDTDAVEILTYFLDTVTTEYILKTENIQYMEAAHKFAKEHRAIGLGVLGWHSYLQSKMIAFESMEAKFKNAEIFKRINEKSLKASKELADLYGEPKVLKGYGERMTTRMAIAPTKSSSFILGHVSQGIEPLNSNYYVEDLAKGKFTYRNPFLEEVLNKHEQNTEKVWKTILLHGGSVQHLDFLSKEEKEVFKTFGEISQKEIVIQAAQRQKFIDQSQSLNLMIPPSTSPKDVSKLLIEGWEMGIKTFYYQKSANPAQELARNILNCSNCEA